MLLALFLFATLAHAQGYWAQRAPMPVQLSEVASATIGGKIYVVGGANLRRESVTTLQIYDPYNDQWTQGPPLPLDGGIDHANVAAAGGRLYVLGGLQIFRNATIGRCFEFDPARNTWREVNSMPTARGAAGTAELGGKIYVAGGQRGDISVSEFAAYDPASNTWEVLSAMPTARNHLTAAPLNGLIYAIGGRTSVLIGAVEAYNPQTRVWSPRTPMLTARSGIASAPLGGGIVVMGGETSSLPSGTFPQNEGYDPSTNSWVPLAQMLVPRHGFTGVTLNRRMYAPGGGPQAGLTVSGVNDVFFFQAERAPETGPSGVVDGAAFQNRVPAGGIASMFGRFLADAPAIASRFPLPPMLNEVFIELNGRAVPMLFVSETQINFQVPPELSGNVRVRMVNAAVEAPAFSINIVPVAPGIFSGAIVHNSTFQRVTTAAPAARGEMLAVFATGLGPVQPPVAAGQAAPATPLSRTTMAVTATIGGRDAEVTFAGLAPGFAGLYQVNVVVPPDAPAGDSVPLVLNAGGSSSNIAPVAIR